jgi:hypothetical protein
MNQVCSTQNPRSRIPKGVEVRNAAVGDPSAAPSRDTGTAADRGFPWAPKFAPRGQARSSNCHRGNCHSGHSHGGHSHGGHSHGGHSHGGHSHGGGPDAGLARAATRLPATRLACASFRLAGQLRPGESSRPGPGPATLRLARPGPTEGQASVPWRHPPAPPPRDHSTGSIP